MRIQFKITIEDMIAFTEFHFAHSPAIKRSLTIQRSVFALVMFVLGFAMRIGYESFWGSACFASVVAALLTLMWPMITRDSMKKRVRKQYSKSLGSRIICEHELEITKDGIIERIANMETKMEWVLVERIESTPNYTFIYVNPQSAYVIPHNRLLEGDIKSFLTELEQRRQPNGQLELLFS